MKIAVSCSKFGVSGGMERYAYDLIYGLYHMDILPTIITRKTDRNLPHLDKFDIQTVNVRFIPGKLRDLFFSWRVNHYKNKRKIETLIACSRISSPDIAICGGTHIGFVTAMKNKLKFSDRLHIQLEKRQYHHAKYIIAHSQLMKEELIQLYNITPDKIKLLYPPVDQSKFKTIAHTEREKLREQLGFDKNKHYFLFPSGSHIRKGLPFLQDFFEKTQLPIELVVIGKTVTGANIRSLPFTHQIEQLYQAADATILASTYEPFGLVGIESVLCNTPIIFADNIGSCEVIDKPAKATFQPNDIPSLHHAIEAILCFDRIKYPDLTKYIQYDSDIKTHLQNILDLIT